MAFSEVVIKKEVSVEPSTNEAPNQLSVDEMSTFFMAAADPETTKKCLGELARNPMAATAFLHNSRQALTVLTTAAKNDSCKDLVEAVLFRSWSRFEAMSKADRTATNALLDALGPHALKKAGQRWGYTAEAEVAATPVVDAAADASEVEVAADAPPAKPAELDGWN